MDNNKIKKSLNNTTNPKWMLIFLMICVFLGYFYFSTNQAQIQKNKTELQKTVKVEKTIQEKQEKEIQQPKLVLIPPSKKEDYIKQAMLNAGRSKPFENLGGISPVSFSSMDNKTLPPLKIIEETDVKGFLGNKAIICVNGNTKALSEGESFKNVKVLKIDVENLTVVFKKDNKTITQSVKIN
ncbi:MAG: hypothetical protein PHV68_03015 [Candidatus Gastranaerophilales bacterium]|nr:hypothetical protein [Candidatus Gastranaerophilales bacterium]